MHFHTPDAYWDPSREYYEKHGFNYLRGRAPADGVVEQIGWQVEGGGLLPSLPENAMDLSDLVRTGIKDDDFVMGLIRDKSKFARAAAEGLARQIYERQRIKEHNLAGIDYDSCRCGTYLLELFVWGDRQLASKRRQTLDTTLFGLERERRAEDVSCWRDISLLKKDLIEALAEYSSAARREGLFRGTSYLDNDGNQ